MFKFFHGDDLGENGRDLNCNESVDGTGQGMP